MAPVWTLHSKLRTCSVKMRPTQHVRRILSQHHAFQADTGDMSSPSHRSKTLDKANFMEEE